MKDFKATLSTPAGNVDIDATAFRPDWTEAWTVEEMETQLSGFKFKGPGWYLHKDSQLLIIPKSYSVPSKAGEFKHAQRFLICSYNHSFATQAFNWIVNAPVHEDTR